MVSTGYRSAWPSAISVPSFWAKNVTGRRSCAASALSIAVATSLATPDQRRVQDRGVLALEQADRADLVAERDVHLAELALDDLRGEQLVPRRDRREHAGDRDAFEAAPVRQTGATSPRNRAIASASNGARSRPSNSMPPPTIVAPTADRVGQVARPVEHRPDRVRRGAPILITATRRSLRRSSTALVACVVPSITCVIRLESTPGARSTASSAAVMPPVTSGVHGDLGLGQHPVGGVEDHGVGVGAADVDAEAAVKRGTGELLHRDVVEVVAERARPGRLPARAAVRQTGSQRIAITVTRWPYRTRSVGDRLGGLAVQHRDQVGHGREHPALLEGHQVLVLHLEADQPARVIAQALDHDRAAHEALGRAPLDVGDLAGRSARNAPISLDQLGHRAASRRPRPPRRS